MTVQYSIDLCSSGSFLFFQVEKFPCRVRERLLCCPVLHPQNPLTFHGINLEHGRTLDYIRRTTVVELGDPTQNLHDHGIREALTAADEESFILCFDGRERFDVRGGQVTNVDQDTVRRDDD